MAECSNYLLISSPLVDLGSLLFLMSIFGWKIAVAYVIAGLLLALLGGYIIIIRFIKFN